MKIRNLKTNNFSKKKFRLNEIASQRNYRIIVVAPDFESNHIIQRTSSAVSGHWKSARDQGMRQESRNAKGIRNSVKDPKLRQGCWNASKILRSARDPVMRQGSRMTPGIRDSARYREKRQGSKNVSRNLKLRQGSWKASRIPSCARDPKKR